VREKGNEGVIHGLRGKGSNHRLKGGVLKEALKIVREKYEDFGPTFANEKLREEHGIEMSVNTLRIGMMKEGMWKGRETGQRHRAWRERRGCVGEMVQLDGSEHDWFEGREERCALVEYIDDATSRILHAEFVKVEDTWNLFKTTKKYLKEHGRPQVLYVDKDSIYKINRKLTVEEELSGETEGLTQYRRAMRELGIEMIFAQSPQAKGRVERSFRTHQDRLVKELRLGGICTIEQANEFLWKVYISKHNERYAVEPANETNVHRPLLAGMNLDKILSIRDKRVVAQDYTVRWKNEYLQISKEHPMRVRPKDELEVEQRLDGSVHLRFGERYLNFKALPERPYRAYYAARSVPGLSELKVKPYRPPKSHPWKDLSYERMLWKKSRRKIMRKAA
jgi:hypothetical protein